MSIEFIVPHPVLDTNEQKKCPLNKKRRVVNTTKYSLFYFIFVVSCFEYECMVLFNFTSCLNRKICEANKKCRQLTINQFKYFFQT